MSSIASLFWTIVLLVLLRLGRFACDATRGDATFDCLRVDALLVDVVASQMM